MKRHLVRGNLIFEDELHNPNWDSSTLVHLNVGGRTFSTTVGTLTQRQPDSMLAGMFSSRQTLRQDEKGYIFIDRDGEHFRHIQRSGANLQRASFNHVDAEGAAFDNADLLESTFVGANLRGATFLGAKSKNYDLTGASCVEDCKGIYEDLITAKT
ncbi:unnamed protein product [Malus baccata var. baccata]